MTKYDVGIVFTKPFGESGSGEFGYDQWRDRAYIRVIALVRGEGTFPAMLETLVLVLLKNNTRAAVPESA